MTTFVFVGENRSPTAKDRDWTWKDGHLAAKPLHEALAAIGVDPHAQDYVNLFTDGGAGGGRVNGWTTRMLRVADRVVVAMGRRVADALARLGIPHVAIVHPAARGKIRKKSRYRKHVRLALAAHVGGVA